MSTITSIFFFLLIFFESSIYACSVENERSDLRARLQTNATSIVEVVNDQEDLSQCFYQLENSNYLFTKIYFITTSKILDYFEQGKFENPDWITEVVIEFHNAYIVSLSKFLIDQNLEVSNPWHLAFTTKISVLIRVLTSMNIHINYDLPRSIQHLSRRYSMSSIHHDYFLLNDLFKDLLPELVNTVDELSMEFDGVTLPRFPGDLEAFFNILKKLRLKSWLSASSFQYKGDAFDRLKDRLLDRILRVETNRINQLIINFSGPNTHLINFYQF